MTGMIGSTISQLGEGGMGVVYRAEDTKLGRPVALKFLPPYLTTDPAEERRFVHEAKAASALNHPNITTIYEIDEHEGQLFIAMELVEGKTLKRLVELGPLAIGKVLDIAIQAGEGLAAAHEKAIVHRDIKSENIMLTPRGQTKIMDFGLAKVSGATKLTKTGFTLGTAAYMSPEQAQGEEVDHRSDIFSFGVVLYELLTGKLPFRGEHQAAVLYSIMHEEPAPIARFNEKASDDLQRIVSKALAKNREERYQHVDELVADLKRERKALESAKTAHIGAPAAQTRAPAKEAAISAAAAKPKRNLLRLVAPIALVVVAAIAVAAYLIVSGKREAKRRPASSTAAQFVFPAWRDSVAVLPFKDFSSAKDQEYFCNGMTEDIITKLSSIHDLKVISRTSVMQYKNSDKNARQIGKELGVGVILEGSIQKEKNEIRVNVQLIRAADDAHLWAEKYDRKLESVFQVQDEIATAIADALELKLTSAERQGLAKRPIDNVEAYEYWRKAGAQLDQFSESGCDSARLYLEKALDITGDNAVLYASLGLVYYQYANIGVAQESYIAKAEEYAKKALALDPNLALAHVLLGSFSWAFLGNPQEAIRQDKIALAEDPNDGGALADIGYIASFAGKTSAAIPFIDRVNQLDPRIDWVHMRNGMSHYYAGQYEFAREDLRQFYEADPGYQIAQWCYAKALVHTKRLNEAISIIDQNAKQNPGNAFAAEGLLLKYAVLKDKEKVFQTMTPDFQKTWRKGPEWSYDIASYLALLGSKEEALDWLENAVNRGFVNYLLLERDTFFDSVRGEERFKKLMERVKHEWEHFEI